MKSAPQNIVNTKMRICGGTGACEVQGQHPADATKVPQLCHQPPEVCQTCATTLQTYAMKSAPQNIVSTMISACAGTADRHPLFEIIKQIVTKSSFSGP